MNSKIYFIPGLGTDGRVFSNLIKHLDLDNNFEILEYITPLNPNEPLDQYTQRRTAHIRNSGTTPIFVGMSLGGIIAVEASNQFNNSPCAIISSIKQASQRPPALNALRHIKIHSLVPPSWTRWGASTFGHYFGVETPESLLTYKAMLYSMNDEHFKWGREAAVIWDNTQPHDHILHIHGNKDHIFPHNYIKHPYHLVPDGTHNMTLDRPEMVAAILKPWLNEKLKFQ